MLNRFWPRKFQYQFNNYSTLIPYCVESVLTPENDNTNSTTIQYRSHFVLNQCWHQNIQYQFSNFSTLSWQLKSAAFLNPVGQLATVVQKDNNFFWKLSKKHPFQEFISSKMDIKISIVVSKRFTEAVLDISMLLFKSI